MDTGRQQRPRLRIASRSKNNGFLGVYIATVYRRAKRDKAERHLRPAAFNHPPRWRDYTAECRGHERRQPAQRWEMPDWPHSWPPVDQPLTTTGRPRMYMHDDDRCVVGEAAETSVSRGWCPVCHYGTQPLPSRPDHTHCRPVVMVILFHPQSEMMWHRRTVSDTHANETKRLLLYAQKSPVTVEQTCPVLCK